MTKPCDICVDPVCKGKRNCHCETCGKRESCPRYLGLKPTIRITRKCTQSCSHCCFSCSPECTDTMTPDMARQVAQFCGVHNRVGDFAEIMGGEFYLNPQWEEVLDTLVKPFKCVRIVSNGDWAGRKTVAKRVIEFLDAHVNTYVGLSRDRWHTNKHVDSAAEMLKAADIPFRVATQEQTTESSIVPVGRASLGFAPFYGMLAAACQNPATVYNLLIDEQGRVYKCGYGAWPYAAITDYLEGGFGEKFKEFNDKFYRACPLNCTHCQMEEERSDCRLSCAIKVARADRVGRRVSPR